MFQEVISSEKGAVRIPLAPIASNGVRERARSFTTRSLKKKSKLDGLLLALSLIDLTTLEGADTHNKIRYICRKALNPVSQDQIEFLRSYNKDFPDIPHVAAVCVYPDLIPSAHSMLSHSKVNIAAVASYFPAGRVPFRLKMQELMQTLAAGANEIDMVIDRGAFLEGNYQKVYDEIAAFKKACGKDVHLKVILETGELGTFENIRMASWLAMEAGADFIKTSTGKINPAANMEVSLVMLHAIWDFYQYSGRKIGMKPAGGVRTAKQAIHYLVMVKEVLGSEWLHPSLFRIGASSLLGDLLRQIFKQATGSYYYDDVFSQD